MTDKQDLGELLRQALADIEEIGGRERHSLAELIGRDVRDVYDKLIAKQGTSDLVDRWEAASGKAKAPAIRALSIAIARVADKTDLVERIQRELHNTFDETLPDRGSKPKSVTREPVKKSKPKIDLASLAKAKDLSGYMRARQKGE